MNINKRRPNTATSVKDIMAALPGTTTQVADRMGLSVSYVYDRLVSLRCDGCVHVSGTEKPKKNGPPQRVYSAGPSPDPSHHDTRKIPGYQQNQNIHRLETAARTEAGGSQLPVEAIPMVRFALQTQPTSVFALAQLRA